MFRLLKSEPGSAVFFKMSSTAITAGLPCAPERPATSSSEIGTLSHLAQYVYKPFIHPDQIRILVLYPTKSRIECRIHRVSHKHDGYQYHALSYAWGSEEKEFRAIVVNKTGQEEGYILLTKNVRDALLDLRDAKELKSKVFWIDQICIDQHGSEKNAQVALMGDIFRKAAGVITYLGPSSKDEEEQSGMRLLARLNAHFQDAYDKLSSCHLFSDAYELVNSGEINSLPQNLIHSDLQEDKESWSWLFRVCFGEWIQRLWIVQEQLLNRNIDMLRGCHILSWDSVVGIIILSHLGLLPQNLLDTLLEQPIRQMDRDGLLSISVFRLWLRRKRIVEDRARPQIWSLHDNMIWCSALKCRDPRDRIYALLAISHDAETLGIVPDYSESNTSSALAIWLSQRFFQADDDLNKLTSACCWRLPESARETPSWAMEVARPETLFTFRQTFSKDSFSPHPRNTTNTPVRFFLTPVGLAMIVKGRILDSVSFPTAATFVRVRGLNRVYGHLALESLKKFLSNISRLSWQLDPSVEHAAGLSRTLMAYKSPAQPTDIQLTMEDEAYRLLCFYRVHLSIVREKSPLNGQNFDSMVANGVQLVLKLASLIPGVIGDEFDPESELRADEEEAIQDFCEHALCYGRSFNLTEAGRFCNAMGDVQQGDSIAAFQGSDRLFVLRPVAGSYQLIGDAYVDGLMDGEAYENIEYETVDHDIELV